MTEAELDATEDSTVGQMQNLLSMSHDKLNHMQWPDLYKLTIGGKSGLLSDKKLDTLKHVDPETKSNLSTSVPRCWAL